MLVAFFLICVGALLAWAVLRLTLAAVVFAFTVCVFVVALVWKLARELHLGTGTC